MARHQLVKVDAKGDAQVRAHLVEELVCGIARRHHEDDQIYRTVLRASLQ